MTRIPTNGSAPLTRWVPGAKVTDEVHSKLKKYCKINGLYMSQAVREALKLYTDDMEEYQ